MSQDEVRAGWQSEDEKNLAIPEGEFIRRFTAEMVRLVGPTYFDEGDPEPQSTAEYAAVTAPSYFAEDWQRRDGPEECARADYSYWGD